MSKKRRRPPLVVLQGSRGTSAKNRVKTEKTDHKQSKMAVVSPGYPVVPPGRTLRKKTFFFRFFCRLYITQDICLNFRSKKNFLSLFFALDFWGVNERPRGTASCNFACWKFRFYHIFCAHHSRRSWKCWKGWEWRKRRSARKKALAAHC